MCPAKLQLAFELSDLLAFDSSLGDMGRLHFDDRVLLGSEVLCQRLKLRMFRANLIGAEDEEFRAGGDLLRSATRTSLTTP